MAKRRNRQRRYPREDFDFDEGKDRAYLHIVENENPQLPPWVGRRKQRHFYKPVLPHQIYEISDTIFNGKYYCAGDDE